MQRREVERMWLVHFSFPFLDRCDGFLDGPRRLLALFIDTKLMSYPAKIYGISVAAFILQLIPLLVTSQKETHPANRYFFVVCETGLFHYLYRFRFGPYLPPPELSCNLYRPETVWRSSVGG